jgi:CRISPR-associated protein (TIGR02584 family)
MRREGRGRKILMVALGLSPQIVTETVYALAVQRRPRWIPAEVHVFTTSEGAERVRLALLPAGQNWFGRLRKEYRLPAIQFGEAEIHVLRDGAGDELVDIRTKRDNEAAANGLSAAVRALTEDGNTELHVSIAGGRKTMGFFAGYALSLYGRRQDRLSHVLVDANWENHPEFFYPTIASRVIYTPPPSSRPLDTAKARVELAEIPFVRMRELSEGGRGPEGFGKAVRRVQTRLIERAALTIDFNQREIRVGGERIPMAPAEMAFAAVFARRAAAGLDGLECPGEGPDPELGAAYLQEYRRLASRDVERTERSLREGMDRAFFLQRRARYDFQMKTYFGLDADRYLIQTSGKRPHTRYAMGLGREWIKFIGDGRES